MCPFDADLSRVITATGALNRLRKTGCVNIEPKIGSGRERISAEMVADWWIAALRFRCAAGRCNPLFFERVHRLMTVPPQGVCRI